MGKALAEDEAMLLQMACDGYTKEETVLAMSLGIAERGALMGRLFRKLGARSFPHAVALAVASGAVAPRGASRAS